MRSGPGTWASPVPSYGLSSKACCSALYVQHDLGQILYLSEPPFPYPYKGVTWAPISVYTASWNCWDKGNRTDQ